MPLQMGGIETERPKLIIWDTDSTEESKEAKCEISRYERLGFRVSTAKAGHVKLVPPPKRPGLSVMRVLTDNGDDRLTWDRSKPTEIKDAIKKFKDFLSKGYKAFAVMANGQKGHRLDDFDPLMEEIIMVPSTVPG